MKHKQQSQQTNKSTTSSRQKLNGQHSQQLLQNHVESSCKPF